MNIKSNIIIALLLSFLIGCIWSTEDDNAGVTGTGNNGVIAVSIKDNTVLQQAKRQALAANELLNISVSLYKESEPTKIVATQTESQDGHYLFSNVDYDTYAVRVDINNEKGGLEKGIVVNSGKIVPVVITINIYITQNITNIIQGNDPVYIDSILNAYNASLLEQLENGDYILKTIPGEQNKVVLKQGDQKQEVEIKVSPSSMIPSSSVIANSSIVISSQKLVSSTETKNSEAALSSEVSSSSSFAISSQSIPLVFKDTVITLGSNNSIDAVMAKSFALQDNNLGGVLGFSIGSYDASTHSRALIKFDIPSNLMGKKIVSAKLKFFIKKWIEKPTFLKKWSVGVHQMLVNWREGTGGEGESGSIGVANSSKVNGVTANERWFGQPWETSFLDITNNKEVKSSMVSSVEIETKIDFDFTLDVKGVVKAWVEDGEDNYGLLLRDLNEFPVSGPDTHIYPTVYTSESSIKKPTLTIEYY